jgi:hypothetical protein
MTVMTDALVSALEDAREAHEAVVDRFRADATITPPGPYRQILEGQVNDVQDSLRRIEHRVRKLRPRSGLVGESVDMARFVSCSAVRTAMLPLTIGSVITTEMLRGRWPNGERRLLRKAEDKYVVTARALAACRAGQSIAEKRSMARQPPTCSLRCAARMRNCSKGWRTASSIRFGPWRPRPTAFAWRTAMAGPTRPAHVAGRRPPGAAVTAGPHGARGPAHADYRHGVQWARWTGMCGR